MKEHWTGLSIGAFILVSPWILGFSDISLARWGNVICGLALILVAVWTIYGDPAPSASVPVSSPTPAPEAPRIRRSKNNKSRQTIQ